MVLQKKVDKIHKFMCELYIAVCHICMFA